MNAPKPFTIAVPDAKLARLRSKVEAYEFAPAAAGGAWEHGTSTAYMKALCAYWLERYDWRQAERGLNRFPQYTVPIAVGGETLDVHFIHERGSGKAPQPLIITHGWPGSVYEFMHIIEPLAHPERFGGDAADAFDVIVPSLPGFGFSGKPSKPVNQRATAAAFDHLMTEVLGYPRYLAQGGDWGSIVSAWMAFDHPKTCAGLHINLFGLRAPVPPSTPEEIKWAQESQARFQTFGGYFQVQSTKPETLGFALLDSPVGTCAWIVEKFHAWSDLKNDDIESRFTKDQLLTNVMIYLVTDSIKTSTWYYRAMALSGGPTLPAGQTITVPTAVANFPNEHIVAWPPRSYAEKAYNIVRWTDMPAGGHFAAMEEPDRFIADVRAFGRMVRA